MGASDAFTREDQELLDYDADAFFYFAFAMLITILTPWTIWFSCRLTRPWPTPDEDYENYDQHKKGAKVRHFKTAMMEAKRQAAGKRAMSWERRLNFCAKLQLIAIIVLWICLGAILIRLKDARQLSSFDPYDILGIEVGAEEGAIKKAYRRKSLEFHPDKNPDNPLASVLFMKVSKAYAALTNEAARKNYEKYGNPDGPVGMKVSVALHPALVGTKEMQLATLCFFYVLLFILPGIIIYRAFNHNAFVPGSLNQETLFILHGCVEPETPAEDGVSLLAASAEARALSKEDKKKKKADLKELHKAMNARSPKCDLVNAACFIDGLQNSKELNGRKGIVKRYVEEKDRYEIEIIDDATEAKDSKNEVKLLKPDNIIPADPNFKCLFSDDIIRRNTGLLWAHMWQLHSEMTPDVRNELDQLLKSSVRTGRAMVAMCIHGQGDRGRFYDVLKNMVECRRCLVQGLPFRSSPFLQLPHVTEAPKDAPDFREMVRNGGPEDALAKELKLTPEQLLDVRAFCDTAPYVELSYVIRVSDEVDIAENDVATLEVTLKRTKLKEGECQGPVHAPLFPIPKHEEWWLVIFDDRSRRLIGAEIILGTGKEEKSKTCFQIPRAGTFRWSVHAMCDSYFGLDMRLPVHFEAKKAKEVKKPYFLHPEDANIKTWFEEIMEGLQEPDDTDSESEEEDRARQQAVLKKQVAEQQAAARAKLQAAEDDSDSSDGDSDSSDGDSDDSSKNAKPSPKSTPKATPKSSPKKEPEAIAEKKASPKSSPKKEPEALAEEEASPKSSPKKEPETLADKKPEAKKDPLDPQARDGELEKKEVEGGNRGTEPEKKEAKGGSISKAKSEESENSDDSSDESDDEAESSFWRVENPSGVTIFREPREIDETRVGSLPQKALVRGFLMRMDPASVQALMDDPRVLASEEKGESKGKGKDGKGKGKDDEPLRPAIAWVELAGSNGCCIIAERMKNSKGKDSWKSESGIIFLGTLSDVKLRVVVQTVTPLRLVRQWMRKTSQTHTIEAEDVLRLREIEADRVRNEVEELARKSAGDERYEQLLDEVEALYAEKCRKLSRAVGTFKSNVTGMLWRVSPGGFVRGLQPNGARIRDRVEPIDPSSGSDEMRLGPFRLANASEASLHWERADEPNWSMTWAVDRSLETRLKLVW